MKYKMPIFCLFIFITSNIIAQSTILDGYIVTNRRDTIYGKIDIGQSNNLDRVCNFWIKEKHTQYYPQEILAYGVKDRQHFTSQELKGQFLEVLLEGQLSLYRSKNNFYIKKGVDSTLLLTNANHIESDVQSKSAIDKRRNWKGILSLYTIECTTINSRVWHLKFNEKDLVQFVKSYNECIGSQYSEKKTKIPSFKTNVGFSISSSYTSLNIFNADLLTRTVDVLYNISSPMVGINCEFSYPRSYQRFTFSTEINYTNLKYHRIVIDNLSTMKSITNHRGSHGELSFPLIVKYLAWRGKLNTYVHFGLNSILLINKNYTTTTEIISPDMYYTSTEDYPLLAETYGLGVLVGVNLQKNIGKSSIGFFARTSGNILFTTNKVDINSEEYATQLGIRFTL